MLIVLGTWSGSRFSTVGEGGKVLKGGSAEGRCREVYRGSKRMEEGVAILLRISTAVSLDPSEAVVEREEEYCRGCLLNSKARDVMVGADRP